MNNPILQSESFENASYALIHSMQDLRNSSSQISDASCCVRDAVRDFGIFVERFEQAVERLIIDGPSV